MSKKFQNFVNTVYGKTSKGRWWKILLTAVVLIVVIGGTIFLVLSGYDKDKGFYKTPTDTKVHIKRGE